MGGPLELRLGTSLVATRLAEALGCTPDEQRRNYWVAMLRHIGCTAGSHEFAALVGDEIAFRGGMGDIDFSDRRALLGYVVRSLGGDSPIGRVRALARFAASAGAMKEGSLAGGEVASRLADVAGDFADLKSPYTIGHSRGVAALPRAASAAAGLGDDEQRRPLLAGLVHDLGRVGVSSAVWGKEAPLSRTEWEQVRLHPYTTARVLDRAASLREVAGVAAGHHERLDGSAITAACRRARSAARRGCSPPPTPSTR